MTYPFKSYDEIRCIDGYFQVPLPKNLKIFRCTGLRLEKLPPLPPTLEILECARNNLKELPELPKSLKILECSSNPLEKLPKLPESLKGLYVRDTLLKELPKLPTYLEVINFQYTYIDSLEGLPFHLKVCVHQLPLHYPFKYTQYLEGKRAQVISRFKELYYTLKYGERFKSYAFNPVNGVVYKMYKKNFERRIQALYEPDADVEFIYPVVKAYSF